MSLAPKASLEKNGYTSADSIIQTPENTSTEILQRDVDELRARRTNQSESLIGTRHTLEEILVSFDNDYTALEKLYKAKTGVELLSDPYEAIEHEIPITKSCSIIIPTYNKDEILVNALHAIQASSFNAKYPQQLEVIVVDDASPTINAAEVVKRLNLGDLNIKVVRHTSNHFAGVARYTGALEAKGEVLLFTDPDVVYTPTMIEEFMKRHEVLDDIACFSFRDDISQNDPRLKAEAIDNGSLAQLDYNFNHDLRIADSAMQECNFLKDSGEGNQLPISTGADWTWDLPGMFWSLSVSAPRETIIKIIGATDDRFVGWGSEDNNLAAELIAEGLFIIPNTGGMALHQEHPSSWNEAKASANARVLKSNLESGPKRQDPQNPKRYETEVTYERKNSRTEVRPPIGIDKGTPFKRAQVLMRMGFYEEAEKLFSESEGQYGSEEWFLYDRAAALSGIGGTANVESAINMLRKSVQLYPENVWMHLALADTLALNDHYEDSLVEFHKVHELDPENWEVRFLDGDAKEKAMEIHETTAKQYLKRGKSRGAIRQYDRVIALVGEEEAVWSVFDKGVALYLQGHIPEAIRELERSAEILNTKTWAYSKLGVVYESVKDAQRAIQYYEQALKEDQDNWEAKAGLERLR